MAQLLLGLLAFSIVGYVAATWYLWSNQRELIFAPTRGLQRTPADLGLKYEDVWLPVGRTTPASLHGWWLQADDAAAPALLYLHGNDLNIGSSVEAVARLRRMGFSVLVVDYRGYGKSGGGFPSEAQVYEDAEAAWNHLLRVRHADPGNSFIYGHSLGGAIAIDLAVRHPDAAGIIVESSFTSMRDVARIDYWMFPTDWILNERFDALAKLPLLRVPVLFIHGSADKEIPYTMSERLYAATPQNKKLTLIPGGEHDESASVGGTLYSRAVLEFTQDHRRGR
jgi:pimeloyl-ACP methyl ester carboxylesterase